MSKNLTRKDIKKELDDRGFSGEIELFFHKNDGWYCNCDQMNFEWLGQNAIHSIERIKNGEFNWLLES